MRDLPSSVPACGSCTKWFQNSGRGGDCYHEPGSPRFTTSGSGCRHGVFGHWPTTKDRPSDIKTDLRLWEAQTFLAKTDAEMDELLTPKQYSWRHMKCTGSISMMGLGRLCRLTGWTMDFLLGEVDAPNKTRGVRRGIACGPNGCQSLESLDLSQELLDELDAHEAAAQIEKDSHVP